MKIQKIRTGLSAIAAAAAMLAMTAPAMAAPIPPDFVINPDALVVGGYPTLSNFTSDKMTIHSSELLTNVGTTGHTGSGTGTITTFLDNGNVVGTSGLGSVYKLYITFTITDHLTGGTFNAAGSTYALDQLDIQFWADPDASSLIVEAGQAASGPGTVGTPAGLTGLNGDEFVLAVANLRDGDAAFNPATGGLGAALNASLNFAVCSAANTALQGSNVIVGGLAAACAGGQGAAFFAEPQPFYDIAFTANNNPGPSAFVHPDDNTVAVRSDGAVEFARSVPEPGSLALVGLGLFAFGMIGKRRKG